MTVISKVSLTAAFVTEGIDSLYNLISINLHCIEWTDPRSWRIAFALIFLPDLGTGHVVMSMQIASITTDGHTCSGAISALVAGLVTIKANARWA